MREAEGRIWPSAAAFLSGSILVAVVAFADGGYFRETWLWTTIALACLAWLALVLRDRIVLARLDLAAVGALGAFVAWIWLSAAWSSRPVDSLHEAERGLVYLIVLLAFALLVGHREVRGLLAGVAAGLTVVAGYSLGARLFAEGPVSTDPVQGTLLFEPLGYANALAILSVVALVLCLGLAAQARGRLSRALWSTTPVVLLPTITLTESRAAALALATGLGVLVLLGPHRAALLSLGLLLAVPAVAALSLTWESSALTDPGATAEAASDAGRRLALALGALALASALASLGADRVELLVRRAPGAVRALAGAVGFAAVFALAVAASRMSWTLGPRTDYWRVARRQWEENPVLGSGAGTFSEYWRREETPADVLDAHSLYLETLAELGPVGLGLLLLALGVPVLAGVRGRRDRVVGVAAGGFAAYLVHAGLDWDWEMPAVTLTGLCCGVGLLAAARPAQRRIAIGPRGRVGFALAVSAVVALALVARVV